MAKKIVDAKKPVDAFGAFVAQAKAAFPTATLDLAKTPKQVAETKVKATVKPVAVVTDWKQWGRDRGICFNARNLQAGTRLFSYTSAWLALTGLIDNKKAPHNLIAALGGSALSHHTKMGNMESNNGMVSLTAKGINYFRSRETGDNPTQHVDVAMKEAFILMMLSGTSDGILVRNDTQIVKI